jgi:branched-chain amino acid transport system substrate-binding protein
MTRVVCILSLILSLALSLSCDSASGRRNKRQEYITIGAVFPLTGEHADEGIRALNGLKLARREINAAGGVLGKKLDIIALDDRGDPVRVVEQYRALRERGVLAIVGSSSSNVTLALAKASEADGIPVISPTASNPEVTKGRRNVFRMIFLDDDQARAVALFARNRLGAKTALLIRGNERYDRMHDVFAEAFRSLGGHSVTNERFTSPDDFAAILGKYVRNRPDVIFCAADYIAAAKLAEAVHKAGLGDVALLGTDAWDGILSFAHKLEEMEQIYYASPFAFDEADTTVARFSQKYFDNFSYTPLSPSALAYSAAQILVAAMEKSGGTDAEGIINSMKSDVFETVGGRIQYDEDNNPHNLNMHLYIMQIKEGYYSSAARISLREMP